IHSSLDPRGLPLRRTRGGTGFSDQGLPVRSPSGLKCIMTAAYQKDDARKQAFQTWVHEWHRGQQDRSSRTKPRSFAYTHTLTKPPDGGSHPLWQAATANISVLTGCLTHLGPAGASWGQLVPAGASWYNTLKLASCHVHRP